MGLAERRAVKEFQETKLPGLKRAIDEAAGFGLDVEVNWEQLAKEEYAHLYGECFEKVYFKPVIEAFREVCKDSMGKDALKAGLKKIMFCNTTGIYYGDQATSFDGGILRIDHDPVSNIDNYNERRDAIVKILEKKL